MKRTIAKPRSFVQRGRPIDATGLFYSLVFVLYASLVSGIYVGRNYDVFAWVAVVSIVSGVLWQIRRWKRDALINRQATEWCRRHYPELVGTPVVDLLVAMVHILHIDFRTLKPSSLLVDLVFSTYGRVDPPFYDLPDVLECLASDARIRRIECSSFSGSTVDDAVQFVIPHPAGESSGAGEQ